MTSIVARTLWGTGLALVLGFPAWAFDVDRFLKQAAQYPAADAAASEAAIEHNSAAQAAILPPWQMELRQEGLGPTDPGNQVLRLALQAPFDPVGLYATQSKSQQLLADGLAHRSRQLRLEAQQQRLTLAWRVLSLRAQRRAIDDALASLPEWQRRIDLRVQAGKLPALMRTRIVGVANEWQSRKLTLQRELAASEAQLSARGLLDLVDGPLPDPATIPQAGTAAIWPEATALQSETRALQAADDAVGKAAWPQFYGVVQGERFETFNTGQHTVGLALGWTLPNASRLDLAKSQIALRRAQLDARSRELSQRIEAETGRLRALSQAGLAEWRELRQQVIPNLASQITLTQSLIERGLSDVWPWIDLRRTQLDASLRAIEAQAAVLEGGYGLWLLASGSASR